MNVRDQIIADMYELGIRPGDTIMVHSSMKSLGLAPGSHDTTPEYVLDSMQLALGDSGTLALPALTFATVYKEQPYWDYYETPVCVGLLPETFRHMPGVVRSLHPLHSVAIRGPQTDYLIADHWLDDNMVGKNSPFRKLPYIGGKILMLGCGLHNMTFMHGMEDLCDAPYLRLPELDAYYLTDSKGAKLDAHVYHSGISRYGAQRYERIQNLLESPALLHGRILSADAFLVDAAALQAAAIEAFKRDPYYFLELRPDAPIHR